MQCYACDQEATRRCPRCGKSYCPEHGSDFCAECLHPASAVPASAVFRGSLLALLVGSVLALWLLIRPPGLPGESGANIEPLPTPTPRILAPPTSPQPGAPSPTPAATPVPSPTPTPAPFEIYVVQSGDTLFDIASRFGVTAEEIIAANGLADPTLINPGLELRIPRPTPTPAPTPVP